MSSARIKTIFGWFGEEDSDEQPPRMVVQTISKKTKNERMKKNMDRTEFRKWVRTILQRQVLFSLGNFFLRQFGSRHGIKGPSGVREGAQYSEWKTTSSFTISVEASGTLTLEPSLAYIIYSSNLVGTKTNFNRLVFSQAWMFRGRFPYSSTPCSF
jgi:hypothetical protein